MQTADALIIGGGIHGCATAWWLARRGFRVVLLEKDHVARHASGVNAGGVRQLLRDVAEIPLSVASMDLWERFAELTGDDASYLSHGQVVVAESAEEVAALQARVADLHQRGYAHEVWVDGDELHALLPALAGMSLGGVVSRRDGAAQPFRATQALADAARRVGVQLREGCRAHALQRSGSVWTVTSDAGRWQSPCVVIAAGAWSPELASQVGDRLPMQAVAPMLMITERVAPFIEPVVILRGRKLSFKQWPNGTVLIGGGHLGQADPSTNATRLNWQRLAESARTVMDLFPHLGRTSVVRAWAGIEGQMIDGLPAIGASVQAEGIYYQCGFSAHGFQLGPGAGQAMAELIACGRSSIDIAALAPGRFAVASPAWG